MKRRQPLFGLNALFAPGALQFKADGGAMKLERERRKKGKKQEKGGLSALNTLFAPPSLQFESDGSAVDPAPLMAEPPSAAGSNWRGAGAKRAKSQKRVGHEHRCPGGYLGVPRARRCRWTFPCTAPGCERRVFYRCVCCKLDVIEGRSKRERLVAVLKQLTPLREAGR
jgi:hypothetical protein